MGVVVGEAEPVDPAVPGDDRDGATVADRRVVADGRVAVLPQRCLAL